MHAGGCTAARLPPVHKPGFCAHSLPLIPSNPLTTVYCGGELEALDCGAHAWMCCTAHRTIYLPSNTGSHQEQQFFCLSIEKLNPEKSCTQSIMVYIVRLAGLWVFKCHHLITSHSLSRWRQWVIKFVRLSFYANRQENNTFWDGYELLKTDVILTVFVYPDITYSHSKFWEQNTLYYQEMWQFKEIPVPWEWNYQRMHRKFI